MENLLTSTCSKTPILATAALRPHPVHANPGGRFPHAPPSMHPAAWYSARTSAMYASNITRGGRSALAHFFKKNPLSIGVICQSDLTLEAGCLKPAARARAWPRVACDPGARPRASARPGAVI